MSNTDAIEHLSLKLSQSVKDELRLEAALERGSVSDVARDLIADGLARRRKQRERQSSKAVA